MISEREKRAIEFEALAIEASAITVEAQGMRFFNETRLSLGQSLGYDETSFQERAEELRAIAGKIRGLNRPK